MSECCGNGCGCHETPESDSNVVLGVIKLEYLQHKVVAATKMNSNEEYEIVPTKNLERGETVWVVQPDDSFIKYKII